MPSRYPNSQLTKWKKEINAGPIISSRIKIQREGNEWVGLCPFHPEKTPSFKVYRNDDEVWCYKCFGCSANGNIFQFIQKFDHVGFTRAVEIVLEIAGVSGWTEGEVQEAVDMPTKEKKPLTTHPVAAYRHAEQALEASTPAREWLAKRGIGMDAARHLHLGFVQSCKDISPNHQWENDGWILFPTFSQDGQQVIAVKYRSLVGKKEQVGDKMVSGILRLTNTATVLYNAGTVNPLEDVFVVEGEPDVATLEQAGYPAVGYPSAEYTPTDSEVTLLKTAKRRFLAGDSDKPGQKAMQALGGKMLEGTYLIRWPEGCKDANDTLLKACDGNTEKFTALVEALKEKALEHPLIDEPIVIDASQIKPKKIHWLWPARVPMGKITVFAGNPDNGKSLATASIAATVTRGDTFRHESVSSRKPADVLMMIGEDDLDDTVVPRLIAAEANTKRIKFLDAIRTTSGKEIDIGLDENVGVLEKQLKKNPRIRLVVIDPISNYLGKMGMNAEQEARGILVPLKRLAAKYNVAMILVMHLNKKNDLDAISRVGGAMAFIGVARAAWLFSRDIDEPEEGEERKILNTFRMLRIKNNLIVPDKSGLAYKTLVRPVQFEDGTNEPIPYIEWGDPVVNSADDALNGGNTTGIKKRGRPASGEPSQKLSKAVDWLRKALADGPRDAKDLITEAGKGEGIKEEMLRNAKDALKVTHEKVGKAGHVHWMWTLPEIHATAEDLAVPGQHDSSISTEDEEKF